MTDRMLADLDPETVKLWYSLPQDIQKVVREMFGQFEVAEGCRLKERVKEG